MDVESLEREAVGAIQERVARPDATEANPVVAAAVDDVATDRSFWGRVLDDDTLAPIAGASLVFVGVVAGNRHLRGFESEPTRAGKTDENGTFEIPPGTAASATGLIRAAGHTSALFNIDEQHPTRELALVLKLRRASELEIHAIDVTRGPIADAKVRVWTDGYQLAQPEGAFVYAEDPQFRASTDLEGVAHFAELPASVPLEIELTLPAAAEPIQFDDVVLAPGDKRVVELKLGGSSRIRGVLIDERAEPVPKQQLWLANHPLASNGGSLAERIFFYTSDGDRARSKPVTDEHGRFEISDVPRGCWWIGPAATHHWFEDPDERAVCAIATRVDVDGVSEVELEVRTQRGLFITATVLDPEGKPTAAPVTAQPETGPGGFIPGYHVRGELNSIGPLMPGKYFVYATGVDGACDSEPVLVDAGARDIELHLRAGGTVRGTTIDAATREPLRCKVYISQPDELYRGTDSDGSFEIGGIPVGRCDVIATTADGRCAIERGIVAAVGGEPVELELALQTAARVRVAYSGPAEYGQFMIFDGDTIVAADGVHTNTSAVHTVPAGHVRIRMRMGGKAEQVRELDVSIGEEPTVRFTFE